MAERMLQVTEPHEATGMTLLEGPSLDGEGRITLVDVTAPAGASKVLRVDPADESITELFSGEAGALTSARVSPLNGRYYLSDFATGTIWSMDANGSDFRPFFDGDVDGIRMQPDDIAFDDAGNLYVTDSLGARSPHWEATGRVVRIEHDGSAARAIANELEAPNGIAFTPDGNGLWVSMNTGNRIDYLTLDEDGSVATASPAIHVDGGVAQVDSLTTDSAGNLYVGLHSRTAVLIYDRFGQHIETVQMRGMTDGSATNVVIDPNSTTAYATVSDADGGYLYRFDALAEG